MALGEMEKGEKEQELDINPNPALTEPSKERGTKSESHNLDSNKDLSAIGNEKSGLDKEIQREGTSTKTAKGKSDLTTEKTTLAKREREGTHPAGWTIMHPLRTRAMGSGKSKKGATTANATNTNGEAVVRSSSEEDADGKKDLKTMATNGTGASRGVGEIEVLTDMRSDDGLLEEEERDSGVPAERAGGHATGLDGVNGRGGDGHVDATVYKVYKRRWFGLVQLVLLNIVVSWDVSSLPRTPPCLTTCIRRDAFKRTCTDFYDIVALLLCLFEYCI